MRGISHEDFQGGTMRKFGSLAAVVAAVLVVALAAWTRQPAGNAQGGATVTGKVKFTGAKPTNPPIDMTEEPKCKAKYTTTPTRETVVVNPNGTLANVFVYVKSGLPASAKYETPKTTVLIDQDGCHYRPHVLGIMVGQTLEIKNSDGILHNIKAKGVKNRPFNISQPTTMTSTRTFSAPEVMVPPKGSTFAGEIDGLFLAILIITGIAFVIVEVGLLWFVVKYRGRPGRKAYYTHGSTRAEVIWTAIPAVTMVALGLISNHYWVKIKGRNSVPPNAYPIAIHAKQFEWQVTYPGPDGQLGTADDFEVRNQVHVPVGRPVVIHLTSEDVIHSFFVPVFRVKQDAVPGMNINVWFQATVPGTYELGCAELCGLGHYRMRAQVFVHTQEEFDAWMKQAAKGGATS